MTFSYVIWCHTLSLFGIDWVLPKSFLELVCSWGGFLGKLGKGDIWTSTLHFVVWSIWRERNTRTFNDVESATVLVIKKILSELREWGSIWVSNCPKSMVGVFSCFLIRCNSLAVPLCFALVLLFSIKFFLIKKINIGFQIFSQTQFMKRPS